MATAFRSGTLGLIQHLFDKGTCTGLSDARLLERFVTGRDEAAFAALVARHGALVLNTCRAVLKDPNAADDAFQATFVLLFRKAGSIRGRDALGAWLHRVAYRTALQARSDAARRLKVEKVAGDLRVAETPDHDDLGAVLHEEIERLPDRFRLPLVLCYLDGMTRDQAADHLRCTEGSVRGRLAKGRELLQRRLTRRGITLAVPPVPPAAIPESLVATTVRAAAGGASAAVGALVTVASRGGSWPGSRSSSWSRSASGSRRSAFAYLTLLSAGHPEEPPAPGRPCPPMPRSRPRQPGPRCRSRGGSSTSKAGRSPARRSAYRLPIAPRRQARCLDRRGQAAGQEAVRHCPSYRRMGAAMSSATTGRDGRFRIDGLPRDGIATASITGPGIETSEVYILTRDMPTIRVKDPMIVNGKNYGPVIGLLRRPVRPCRRADAADRRHRPRQGHRRPDRRGAHHRHAQHPQQHDPDARRRGDHRRSGPLPGQRPAHIRRVQALHRGAGRPALCELRVRLARGRAQAGTVPHSTSP